MANQEHEVKRLQREGKSDREVNQAYNKYAASMRDANQKPKPLKDLLG